MHPRAFSLIELVIVVAIIAVIAAVAAPRYGMAATRYRADLAARRIAEELRFASELARAQECEVTANADMVAESLNVTFVSGPLAGEVRSKFALDSSPYDSDLYLAQRAAALGSPVFDAQGLATEDAYIAVMAGRYYAVVAVQAGQSTVEISELRLWGGGSVDLSVGSLAPDTVLVATEAKAEAIELKELTP